MTLNVVWSTYRSLMPVLIYVKHFDIECPIHKTRLYTQNITETKTETKFVIEVFVNEVEIPA